jgi:hypothetical protein
MPNGRCRMHGGPSTGPRTEAGEAAIRASRTKHGRKSQAASQQRRQARETLRGLPSPARRRAFNLKAAHYSAEDGFPVRFSQLVGRRDGAPFQHQTCMSLTCFSRGSLGSHNHFAQKAARLRGAGAGKRRRTGRPHHAVSRCTRVPSRLRGAALRSWQNEDALCYQGRQSRARP